MSLSNLDHLVNSDRGAFLYNRAISLDLVSFPAENKNRRTPVKKKSAFSLNEGKAFSE